MALHSNNGNILLAYYISLLIDELTHTKFKKNNTWLDIVRSLSTSMQSKLRLFVFERVIDIQNPQNSPIFVWVLQFTYLKKSTAHSLCVVGVYPSTFI